MGTLLFQVERDTRIIANAFFSSFLCLGSIMVQLMSVLCVRQIFAYCLSLLVHICSLIVFAEHCPQKAALVDEIPVFFSKKCGATCVFSAC